MGQTIYAKRCGDSIRAIANYEEEQDPHRTWRHLQKRFGDSLGFVVAKMESAANQVGTDQLKATAYQYYMHIRPDIPSGTKGWGTHGHLDTAKLSSFYKSKDEKRAEAATRSVAVANFFKSEEN
jgi:hypothetical protein